MKMFNSQTLIFVAIALVLAFAVPLKAQDSPQDYLNVHNKARQDVGVPKLKWRADMAGYARDYVAKRRDCRPIGSGGPYGENFATSNGAMSGTAAVTSWVNEKNDYFYNSNTCRAGKTCKRYKQVVWRNTEWLGCAKVRCNNGGTLVMCCYSPRGNTNGGRPY